MAIAQNKGIDRRWWQWRPNDDDENGIRDLANDYWVMNEGTGTQRPKGIRDLANDGWWPKDDEKGICKIETSIVQII